MKIPNYHTSIPSAVLAALALSVTSSSYAQIFWNGPATGGTWNTTNTNWGTTTPNPWLNAGNFANLGDASVNLGSTVKMNGFSGSSSINATTTQQLRLGGAGTTSTFSGTIGNNVQLVYESGGSAILDFSGTNNHVNLASQWVLRSGTLRLSSATALQTTNSAKVEMTDGMSFTFELAAADLRINTTNSFLNSVGTATTRFAALGADRTVTWTGGINTVNAPATTFNWGETGMALGKTLGLGNTNSTGKLIWASAINLNGGSGSVLTRNIDAINGSLGAIGGEISGIISDTGTTKAILNKTGTGTLVFSSANTYAGATTISDGTLATGATGTFGAGNVTISSAVGTLTLGNANSIADTATLSLFADSSLFLNYSGIEQVGALTVAGSALGINDVEGSDYFNTNLFSAADLIAKGYSKAFGTGLLQVGASAIPEPSTFAALAGLGMLGFAACRRRRSV